MIGDDAMRPHVLRALADRPTQLKLAVPALGIVTKALEDKDAAVRLAAVITIGRLGDVRGAKNVLPFTVDKDLAIQHAAVKALVALKAIDVTLADIDTASSTTAAGTTCWWRARPTATCCLGCSAPSTPASSEALRRVGSSRSTTRRRTFTCRCARRQGADRRGSESWR